MFNDLFQISGLSLDRLHSFLMVAEAQSVTRAAGGDPNRQSLFSRQIKELEEFFGVELVHRDGRGIGLTAEGTRLRVLLQEQFLALQDFRRTVQGKPVDLCIGAGDSLIHWLILPRLAKLKMLMPEAIFKVMNLSTAETVERLWKGTVQIALVRGGAVDKPLKTASLGKMEYSLFVPSALLQDYSVYNERLLELLPIATLEGTGKFRELLADLCRTYKIEPRFELQFSSFALVARSVQTGCAAAILPSIACTEFDPKKVTHLRLNLFQPLTRTIYLAWNGRVEKLRPQVVKLRALLAAHLRLERYGLSGQSAHGPQDTLVNQFKC